ncbi:MAG: DUF11 domain-containing protein [Actinomycetales bacterium]|nr:DUF11 domain-containing protein [Candidatus Phosphoribacter baldrii]
MTIVKSLNDDDANTAPGVSVVAGSPVTVTFVVTNTGTAHLANVTVTDFVGDRDHVCGCGYGHGQRDSVVGSGRV